MLKDLEFKTTKVLINDIKVMNGRNNSYVLYFSVRKDEELRGLQTKICEMYPSEKYNSNNFIFHITLHICKDRAKIEKIKNEIVENFMPFEVNIIELGLFEIYPAKRVV